jgi:hypothetical protein
VKIAFGVVEAAFMICVEVFMSIRYGELSKHALQKILDVTPPDVPHYQKARDEMARLVARRGHNIARVGLFFGGLTAFVAVAANAGKIVDLLQTLFR